MKAVMIQFTFGVVAFDEQSNLLEKVLFQKKPQEAAKRILTAEDGNLIVKNLRETSNRDLMMAVVGDIVPKFKDFASQLAEEKIQ